MAVLDPSALHDSVSDFENSRDTHVLAVKHENKQRYQSSINENVKVV